MKGFKLLVVFLSLMITIGCSNANLQPSPAASSGVKSGQVLKPILTVDQVGQTCRFSFTVKNQTEKPLSLTFNTTQRFDYMIKDESGHKEVQFSKSHFFGQMVSTLTLKPGENLHYKGTLPKLEPGHYQITFWLSDDHYKPKIQQNFVVN